MDRPFSHHSRTSSNQSAHHFEFGRNRNVWRDTYASGSTNPTVKKKKRKNSKYSTADTDSERDVYGARRTSSEAPQREPSSYFSDYSLASHCHNPYPAWISEHLTPLTMEEIEGIFLDLSQKFGFQRDSMRNMFDFLMQLLDSRASRMTPSQALLTLHADYIGGQNANYRKWYFAAQLNLDDAIGQTQNPGLSRLKPLRNSRGLDHRSLDSALNRWRCAMNSMSEYDRLRQLALYLLCWGEASQVRFMPECLCFIFKCADDYYRSVECQDRPDPLPEGFYLRTVIQPLYRFVRDQIYEVVEGKFVRREKDHESIIGYDDVNQTFWYPEGIANIVLDDKTRIIDLPPQQRFMKFEKIDWNSALFKTYYEKRSFGHLLVNFNRIWVIHIALFYFYTAYNCPTIYRVLSGNRLGSTAMEWSVTALGGAVATLIMILATLVEFCYIPMTWHTKVHLTRRLLFLLATLGLTGGLTAYVAITESEVNSSAVALAVAKFQFAISVMATFFFAITPSGRLCGDRVAGKSRKYLASQTFTASYPALPADNRFLSILLWSLVFGCKGVESYWFLTLSFRDPIQVMVGMKIQGCSDILVGNTLCANHAAFTLTIMYIMDLILFFLDTFLWYIIWSAIFSVLRSFSLGISTWKPWKDIYSHLPEQIYAKLLATAEMEVKYKPITLASQIWNSIIISMYREHLLSIDNVQKLLYHVVAGPDGQRDLRAPVFFDRPTAQRDELKGEFFPPGGEAERRISFFAQSLTTPMPAPLPVDAMPTFTVLTPHYNEKTLLSLREIIREEDSNTRVTLLEYLKQLYAIEWENFKTDTKLLVEEEVMLNGGNQSAHDQTPSRLDAVPFYIIGLNGASAQITLRTRIWASLRTQTLYRTVSGMMNYSKAIKLLYRVENPEIVQLFGGNTDKLERELERMARRKFKFVVAMQRYSNFNTEEKENAEFLLRAYPDLQIAYLEEEPARSLGGESRIFSVLVNGHSALIPGRDGTEHRKPKFRIELPGNPILGDGKSDNQNHALIFYRGEYLQLIDANQDNYSEECLKIRSVLGEFEELNASTQNPYAQWNHRDFKSPPVAIVGAREYIFSENVGILGDLAAAKEQTFGTLSARLMAYIGGKLHYGHPDFLNGTFMTTRGGVSKAQKGLHLNEDIYAGMNAFCRGGRIKHTEYYQCGKGRDLGFGTILNFQTKIGTGMGEQMLSREYYYLGTQLPIDRFLTFYYAHPGFHINNMLVTLSVQVIIISMVFLGTLNSELTVCGSPDDQLGCYNLAPVFQWIERCILSILLVFIISFLPPFLQEFAERGSWKALLRLAKQLGSFSPAFEIFSTQIYNHSILSNLTFGGARYIATGRGFATKRISFSILFSRFAGPSIYLGMRTLLMLLYVTLTLWTPYLIYFWITILFLCISPFLFNPHQFVFSDFIIDYREFLRWMARGNSKSHGNSWIGYCRLSRTMITGYKRKTLGNPSEKLSGDTFRATWGAVLFSEIIFPLFMALLFLIAYLFVKSFPVDGKVPPSPLIRISVIAVGPIAWNAAILMVQLFVSMYIATEFPNAFPSDSRFASVMAAIVHVLAVLGLIGAFEFLWFLELWDASHTVIGLMAAVAIQRAIHKVLISVFLSRELKNDKTNMAWWSGRWHEAGLGKQVEPKIAREFFVKIVELSLWSSDLLIGHFLLFLLTPPILVPYFDWFHSTILFWLRPTKQIRAPLFSLKQRRRRRWVVMKYSLIYFGAIATFIYLVAIPPILRKTLQIECSLCDIF